jgi:hypothetical protein
MNLSNRPTSVDKLVTLFCEKDSESIQKISLPNDNFITIQAGSSTFQAMKWPS